jgi:hypothetical protein
MFVAVSMGCADDNNWVIYYSKNVKLTNS